MKRTLAFSGLLAIIGSPVMAQNFTPPASNMAGMMTAANAPHSAGTDLAGSFSSTSSTGAAPRIYRDPRTGRLMKQELQMVDVPVTKWQRQWVDRTVSTPQTTTETRVVPQNIVVPKTDQVLQTKIKNAWNPFAQPVYAYEHVPVTRWEPQTQLTQAQVPVTRWVSRVEKVPVDQPIQTTEKQPRWVVSEVTDPTAAQTALAAGQPRASGRQVPGQWTTGSVVNSAPGWPMRPSVTAPLAIAPAQLAATNRPYSQGPILPAPATPTAGPQGWAATQPSPAYTNPAFNYRSVVPVPALSGQTTYRAPLNVATQSMGTSSRDPDQSGLPPTIVR